MVRLSYKCSTVFYCSCDLLEPTSGLDSATSVSVIHILHRLSNLGVNITATLHQPRQEILNLMHDLILLAPGGRVVYSGPVFDLEKYFSDLGIHIGLKYSLRFPFV